MGRVNIVKQVKVDGKWTLRSIPKKKSGHYDWAALPDGDYFVVAIRDELTGDWPDPRLLESFRAGATRISISDGDRKVQDLRTLK